MFSRGTLGVFALAVAEFLVFQAAAGVLGTSTVVLVTLGALIIGAVVVRLSLAGLVARRPDQGLRLVAGALITIPGFLTGLVGLALLAPPVRALARRRLTDHVLARFDLSADLARFGPGFGFGAGPGTRFGYGPDGEVIDVDLAGGATSAGTDQSGSPNPRSPEDHPQSAPGELH